MHWKMNQTLNENKNHHIDETVKTAFKDFDMDSRVFLAKLKKFGFEKQYKKMLKNFDKHAKPGDGFYFIDGGRELGFQVHPVADMMLGPKIKKLGDTQDLGGGKTARLIAIKEGVQVVENVGYYLPGQATTSHGGKSGRGGKPGPRMTKQRRHREEVLMHLITNGIKVTNQPSMVTQKGSSDTFAVPQNQVKKAEKILDDFFKRAYIKKSGMRRDAYTIIAEGVQVVEQKRKFDARDHSSRVNVTFIVDADQNSYESITRDPALRKLPGFLGLGRTIFHSRKKKAEFTFRAAHSLSKVGMNEKDEGKFKKLLKKHGLKLVDTIYEGSKKLDEGLAARDIQGMIKGLNNKAKQEIAGVLNDMNLSGYGDYEARADNVHKFKPKDLLKAMNKVMKLEQANIVEFNDKFMKKGKYASKQDKAHHAKKRKEFERELKKAGIKFHFVAGNRKGPVEDTYYVSFKNNQKAHQIANKLFAGAVFSSEIQQFRISAVSEVSFSEFSESVQLDEGSTIEFKFDNPMKAGAFMRRIMRDKLASEVDRYGGDRSPEEIVQVIMYPNDYERNDIERLAKQYKGELLEDLQIDEMSARDHYRRYKNKNRVTSIDRERFPNREREGLEGPYRTKKTGLIYYYDTKAKKYYDPQTDMYLSVDDIMESMGINEQKVSTFVVELDAWYNVKRYANFLKEYGIVKSEKDYTIQRRKVTFKYKPVRGVSFKHIELLGIVLKNVGGKFRRIDATPEIEKTAREAHKKAKFKRDIADEDRRPIEIPKNFFDVDYEKIRRDHEDAVRRAQDESINESDHYSKKDLYTDKDIKKLSKAYGNESYKGGFRGDKEDLPGAVKQMLRYISNYSNNDLIVIALADIPHASTQAKIELKLLRGYEIKGRPPKKRSDFVKK